MAMNEFRDCIMGTGLIHLPVQGEMFTWHNCSEGDRSLWKRLDRLLVNDNWLRQWPDSYCLCLNARTSDHSPMVLRGDTSNHTVSMFRFDNYLTVSSEFTPLVQNVWRHTIAGTSMYAVTRKLRALKPVFRTLRKKKGDLSLNVKLAAEFLGKVQQLLQIDRHNTLLIRLEKCCKLVFLKATKLEQIMLQQRAKIQWLKGGDQCSRIFFRKVAMRRASKRVFQIMNEDGNNLTTQEDVVNEFVSFYQRLLGGDRRREFIDLRHLRPWARHVLTRDESQALVRPVTREDIKDAFFDIAEDKAPGPDGYPSGFYKAAWPVIGEEVVKAILEFFITGRLLRQVNTTILALIPKELFTGYNRQGLPKRCALKVDLRKAYDTVEWDFLSAVLQLFGFRAPSLDGLRSVLQLPCSRSASMGTLTVFQRFQGSTTRGPDVPVLVCADYGDDLLLFCKAEVASVQVFRQGLDEFAKLSGLHANPQRASLFYLVQHRMSGSNYLQHFSSRRGTSIRYLGLPLLASRLSISDCKPLLLKIDSRLKGWESIQLSFAGRLQLIKSVLMALNVYWAMAFILPKGVIREVEKNAYFPMERKLRSGISEGGMECGVQTERKGVKESGTSLHLIKHL
ncbi:hypothetical protein Sango_3047100 [Sesamum angolense]|uniref:Reverse transcriptase domain-containing protein n=1 Tax=Sesamum angolense TaxID=2727404 RepID=A0AAE1TAV5_9LAMI|nr:hypothetical protein Sango_3047100 [Sesamum angolense]